jgi:hypothetical protein
VMSDTRYIRDTTDNSVVFVDQKAYREYCEKRSVVEQLQSLQNQINSMREELLCIRKSLNQESNTTGE